VIIACLEKTASPTPAIVGQPLTFTITASIQNGATAVTGYVTDYLPTDVTFVSATSGQGTCVYDDFAHTVTCGPYGLNSENPDFAATTMTIVVTSNSPGTITNTTNGPYGLVASATVEVVERPTELQTKAECKNGGYDEFGFKNQGQCNKAVNATN
jgi:uncharacterized repeat protein (TIGR01451 family)